MKDMKGTSGRSLRAILCTFAVSVAIAPTFAQGSTTNSFFGNAMPGTTGPNPAPDDPPGTNNPKTKDVDFSDDEKRVQAKLKNRLAHDQSMIVRGEHMMKSCPPTSKQYKKGKVMKEIGERDAAELKTNHAFLDSPGKGKKKDAS